METAGLATGRRSLNRVCASRFRKIARGLLFVAEVFTGDNRQIAMLPWNLPSVRANKTTSQHHQKALWAQPEPILDVLLVDSDSADAGFEHELECRATVRRGTSGRHRPQRLWCCLGRCLAIRGDGWKPRAEGFRAYLARGDLRREPGIPNSS